jgi:hypothetical protein
MEQQKECKERTLSTVLNLSHFFLHSLSLSLSLFLTLSLSLSLTLSLYLPLSPSSLSLSLFPLSLSLVYFCVASLLKMESNLNCLSE